MMIVLSLLCACFCLLHVSALVRILLPQIYIYLRNLYLITNYLKVNGQRIDNDHDLENLHKRGDMSPEAMQNEHFIKSADAKSARQQANRNRHENEVSMARRQYDDKLRNLESMPLSPTEKSDLKKLLDEQLKLEISMSENRIAIAELHEPPQDMLSPRSPTSTLSTTNTVMSPEDHMKRNKILQEKHTDEMKSRTRLMELQRQFDDRITRSRHDSRHLERNPADMHLERHRDRHNIDNHLQRPLPDHMLNIDPNERHKFTPEQSSFDHIQLAFERKRDHDLKSVENSTNLTSQEKTELTSLITEHFQLNLEFKKMQINKMSVLDKMRDNSLSPEDRHQLMESMHKDRDQDRVYHEKIMKINEVLDKKLPKLNTNEDL